MNKVIAVVFALYVLAKCTGCVIGTGTINIYSPQDGASVDKTTDATIDIPLIP